MLRSLGLVLVAVVAIACGHHSTSTTPKAAADPTPLNEESLKAFIGKTFPDAVKAGTVTLDYGSGNSAPELFEEFDLLGYKTIGDFAAIVPPDFATKGIGAIAKSEAPNTTIAGLVRDILIIHDVRAYFEKAWRNTWSTSGPQDFPAPAAYGVDFNVMTELGVFDSGGEEGGDDGYDPCAADSMGDDEGDEDPCSGGE